MNTWAVAVVRYGAGILDWKDRELKCLDRGTRKLMTMHGAFHPKSDVDRLYLKRHDGGRELISIEHCVRAKDKNLGFYVLNSTEILIKEVCASRTIETEGIISKMHFKRQKPRNLNRNG